MSTIKDWPEEERPREKLLQRGSEQLTNAELLGLILRSGDASSGRSAVDQARSLLSRFGGLRELAQACTSELCEFPGIGPARAAPI